MTVSNQFHFPDLQKCVFSILLPEIKEHRRKFAITGSSKLPLTDIRRIILRAIRHYYNKSFALVNSGFQSVFLNFAKV
jgi:hypothetical protein